ncbi:exodeoxyribonuclease V subunit gamma [Aliiglaciecola sp. NS0011-25]|uniref:exodeoxyribonuclease V subunit gamma n=1 Tax=Aliiglaciecola sp. NS0011-25 TaxID=3127654 RepID=UPI003105E362
MLHLIQSNKMEVLQADLLDKLSPKPSQNSPQAQGNLSALLVPETIIVQSPGMAQWIKIAIAETLGVAANIEFPLPSSYIWQQYKYFFNDLPETSAFTKPNMVWKLMSILEGFLDTPEFTEIKLYLNGDRELKFYQLCQKIADVFDQYQVYRPEWINLWETGENSVDGRLITSHLWQPILWRALVAQTRKLGESVYHRANLHAQLLQKIAESEPAKEQKPLYVFGISTLPQQQLDVFEALAAHRDVFLFWCNPSQHFWGDIVDENTLSRHKLKEGDTQSERSALFDVGNPLLASWGKPGRDYLEMLLASSAESSDIFVEVQPDTLLSWLQHEMYELTMRDTQPPLSADELLTNGVEFPKIEISEDDKSVQIHSCHSKVRELEVLHDHLLSHFSQDAQLKPSDIVVMMPDVAAYAPYIDGVFGSAESDLFIPYGISDRNAAQESHIIESFINLLNLHQSRISLSEILVFLEIPAIQKCFDISASEYKDIRDWLIEVGFRWGLSGDDKTRWAVPEESQNTLIFALERLLSGYAMSGEFLFTGRVSEDLPIAPYKDIEGQRAIALGKLYQFALLLQKVLKFCLQSDTLDNKVQQSLSFIELIYSVDENEQVYLNQLRQALESMQDHINQFNQNVCQDVFVAELTQRLQDKGVGQRFLAGKVNFCTLMPMRSIPFKIVCLLGMNDQDYPRQTVPIGFDLMRETQNRRGDRSRRMDDRYLFLEAILSARKELYVSFLGNSSRDNSERNPSILVTELLDYCQQVFCVADTLSLPVEQTQQQLSKHLMQPHGLQPFSKQYFDKSNNLQSYQPIWLKVLNAQMSENLDAHFFTETLPSQLEDNELIVELNDLIAFFQNPPKFFFRQRWRTSLSLYFNELVDEEPFDIDSLTRFQLNDTILDSMLKLQMDEEAFQQQFYQDYLAQGKLPTGAAGPLSFNQIWRSSESLRNQLIENIKAKKASLVEVDQALENGSIQGWLKQIYGTDLVLYRAGKIRGKDMIELWLKWLCYCASSERKSGVARYLNIEKPLELTVVPQAQAIEYLNILFDVFASGLNKPPLFFANSAKKWLETQDIDKTLAEFNGTIFSSGEGQETNIHRVCPDLSANFAEFKQLSEMIFAPIFDYKVSK